MDYCLKIMSVEDIAHDTRKIVVIRPSGFIFQPGKLVLVSINKPGYEENKQPFSFFSLNTDYYLELIYKADPSRGNTAPFFSVKAGEEIILSDVVGNLEYQGPGTFLAAGKGIISCLNIFQHLKKYDALPEHTLLCFARSQQEVPFERLLTLVFKNNASIILSNSAQLKKIDEDLLRQKLPSLGGKFYVIGPGYFVENALSVLQNLHVNAQSEIID